MVGGRTVLPLRDREPGEGEQGEVVADAKRELMVLLMYKLKVDLPPSNPPGPPPRKCTVGCPNLDALLGGGVPCASVTELA
ncbi:hypothetical protein QJS04_geneDACA001187 [Acorus gramineus]|uniref:Uncharacterized protein n=1 Tax=Acorus gramineus TaxID=55184 RepID=A0AAV9AEE7_ACOGR|nr:hypothetical protein QJS04_geneDACA001187 [Acorus gramineus]